MLDEKAAETLHDGSEWDGAQLHVLKECVGSFV